MATKAKEVKREITVMEVAEMDDDAQFDFLNTITMMALEGMAYVRAFGSPEAPIFCVSNLPMSERQALEAIVDKDKEPVAETQSTAGS
jgi:hypothetical protein